jgi:dihydroorotase
VRELELTQPDDWHLHLRDGAGMRDVLRDTARVFRRAIVMPNLKPPVTHLEDALEYRDRILTARPDGSDFEPLMTLYLTDNTSPEEIIKANASGHVYGCKLYPAGATTNSDSGVTDIKALDDVAAAMSDVGMPLLLHGEVTDAHVDIFDREAHFVDGLLIDLLKRHPGLRVVLEHITTARAAQFVTDGPDRLAATITAHHLLDNRNSMLVGGIRPHLYCLPILKRETDRRALVEAATSGSPKFFLGTDSAPHAITAKENACGCAGCYTAHAALGLYAEAFDAVGQLDKLEGFASHNGPDFYGLPRNEARTLLVEADMSVPDVYKFGAEQVVPYRAGGHVAWSVAAHQN